MSEHDHENGDCRSCGEEDNIIELTGENGETLLVEYLATLKMQDKQYAVMRSCDDNEDSEDSEEVIIMKIENDGEEDYLISIDDEEELNMVFEAFKKAASEDFDFE
ncbi:MAG: DUF1292 domain-containing protein [Clostridiaceae bacterium]|nr:DUF1292 domain-containing protein [Clostridiaceae bacterium]